MVNYKEGKIYKIISNQTTDIYIGSTVSTLTKRLSRHKKGDSSSCEICKYDDVKIILIEKYPCNDKDELRMREQYHIDNTDCINKRKAFRTEKDKAEYKQDKVKYSREWNKKNYNRLKEDKQKYKTILHHYKSSWGERAWGNPYDLNMLNIDVNLFLE